MNSKSDVLKKFADGISDRIVRKAVRELRAIKDTLSEEDGILQNAWEEICVQVQYQDSYFWDAYEATARSIISRHVAVLKLTAVISGSSRSNKCGCLNAKIANGVIFNTDCFDVLHAPARRG